MRTAVVLGLVIGMVLGSGCNGLLPKPALPSAVYSLDDAQSAGPATRLEPEEGSPTLIVNPTRAAPGYDSQHMIYVRVAHQLEHFARSDWMDTPARMLGPLIVLAVERTGSFRAVLPSTSGIAGDLRLDTDVMRLQQAFGGGRPSRVRFTLRATLSDNTTRQVISWREFDEIMVSTSEDSYGGVVAANRVVQIVMDQLARHCRETVDLWRDSNLAASEP